MKHQYFTKGRFATIHHIQCDESSLRSDIATIIGKVKDSTIQLSHDFIFDSFNFPTKAIELELSLVVIHTNPEEENRVLTTAKEIETLLYSFKHKDFMVLKDNKLLVNISKLNPITDEEKTLFTNLKKESIVS